VDLGVLVEGVVELDPISGRMVLRVQQPDGSNTFVDVQEQLERYKGEEVRFIVTPQRSIQELARMVESGDLPVDQVPTLKTPGSLH
jgi:hypothetical protein